MVGVSLTNKTKKATRSSYCLSKRNAIIKTLLSVEKNGDLPHGALIKVSRQYKTDRNLVGKIWRQHKNGEEIKDQRYRSRQTELKETISSVQSAITKIDQQKRSTLSALSNELEKKGVKISKSHLHNIVKKGHIKCVVNHVKPKLNMKQKIQRLNYCIDHINLETHTFHSPHNVIHIDEKFYLQLTKRK